jgi:hypothetical protein
MAKPSPDKIVWFHRVSIDTWAVLLAFAAALLVRLGVLKTVAW